MNDEKQEVDRDHVETMARIASRKEAFAKNPAWFTIWDIFKTVLNVAFWLSFWFIVAQCSCDGCITGAKP
jgi:hypothetical protein